MAKTNRKKAAAKRTALATTTGPQGPNTREGKLVVSRNAIQHGITASSMLVGKETTEEWETHVEQVVAAAAPNGNYLEREIAIALAHALWKQRRVARYEAAATNLARKQADKIAFLSGGMTTAKDIRRLAVIPASNRCQTALRYAAAIGREITRLQNQLAECRKARSDALNFAVALSALAEKGTNYETNSKPAKAVTVKVLPGGPIQ